MTNDWTSMRRDGGEIWMKIKFMVKNNWNYWKLLLELNSNLRWEMIEICDRGKTKWLKIDPERWEIIWYKFDF